MGIDISNKKEFLQFTATELMISVDSLSMGTEFRKIPTWSSLNALIYVSRINEESGVLISANDLVSSKTLEDIYRLILERKS